MDLIAYIPARAGSKRVTRKNVRLLNGKPVLCHVIEAIRKTGLAKAVTVSTDDEEIKKIAEEAGAIVLGFRGPKLSDDRTTLMELLQKDVPRYLEALGMKSSRATVLFSLATAALVDAETYRKAHKEFIAREANVLVATTKFSHSPYRALARSTDGAWKPLFPKKLLTFSQELPQTQVDAGLFYFLNFAKMSRHHGHWFNIKQGLACYPAPDSMAVDVDTEDDWRMLEEKYKALHGTKS